VPLGGRRGRLGQHVHKRAALALRSEEGNARTQQRLP